MDKGGLGSRLGPEISVRVHRFSLLPAAAVTTYAAARVYAAGTSAPAGFGGCTDMTARKAGTPPLLLKTLVTVNAISDMSVT